MLILGISIGIVIGGTVGSLVMALCIAARDGDKQGKVEYRCQNTTNSGCGSVCC